MKKSLTDLLRESAEAAVKPKGPRCIACQLPEDILEEVRRLRFRTPPLPFQAIAAGLEKIGHALTERNLAEHFRKHERR